jgi:hypothetical protein
MVRPTRCPHGLAQQRCEPDRNPSTFLTPVRRGFRGILRLADWRFCQFRFATQKPKPGESSGAIGRQNGLQNRDPNHWLLSPTTTTLTHGGKMLPPCAIALFNRVFECGFHATLAP